MTDFNHTETYLQNDGWYHLELHWTTPGGEKRKAPMEGTGLGSYSFEGNNYGYKDVFVTGPGGTRWDIELDQGHNYTWWGPIWDQKVTVE